jgi:hypothetical protein
MELEFVAWEFFISLYFNDIFIEESLASTQFPTTDGSQVMRAATLAAVSLWEVIVPHLKFNL